MPSSPGQTPFGSSAWGMVIQTCCALPDAEIAGLGDMEYLSNAPYLRHSPSVNTHFSKLARLARRSSLRASAKASSRQRT